MYILIYPELIAGAWIVRKVLNSECQTYEKAELLLSDRVANGEAFPGERVAAAHPTDSKGMGA